MATNGRFALSLKVLAVLARDPGAMCTSASIAETLGESAVMIRRSFLLLNRAGFIQQRKGPSGGARLKLPPKDIGLGDLHAATSGDWLAIEEPSAAALLTRVRADAIKAMNETTLAQVVKRLRKGQPASA